MYFPVRWLVRAGVSCAAFCATTGICLPQDVPNRDIPQEWAESQVIERFMAMSPHVRELRAGEDLAQAKARTRTVYANPSISYSREGAGYNEFFEATQTLPTSGRIRYLREAGAAAVSAAGANRDAVLWSLRSDLRLAFYRMVASQERVRLLTSGVGEVEQLIRVLRQREQEGEGSRYDRLRAERELAELRADVTSANTLIAQAAARLNALLPEDTRVQRVTGTLQPVTAPPLIDELLLRATAARAELRTEQQNLRRYQLEAEAARRLRHPEPQISAGLKRADVTSGIPPNLFSNTTRIGLVFSISIPLPVFHDGRYEVAEYQAEQEQIKARLAVLVRQIRTEVQGARAVLALRIDALADYQRESAAAGIELTRIARVAWEEGELGILELLDSLRVNRLTTLRLLDLQAASKEASIELERVLGEELKSGEVRP